MKKTDFVNVIRKLVRDEVQKIVKPLIVEEMNKQMARLLAEVIQNKPSTASGNNGHSSVIVETPQPKPNRPMLRTGNSALDEALNSTNGRIVPEGNPGGVSMLSEISKIGESEGIDIAEFLKPKPREFEIDNSSNLNMLKSIVGAGSVEEVPSVLDLPDEINPLASVMKQDFRSKMRAINEKAKSVSSGNLLNAMVGSMPGPSSSGKGKQLRSGPINEAIE
jgi:hypothetical protein